MTDPNDEDYTYPRVRTLQERVDLAQAHMARDLAAADLRTHDQIVADILADHTALLTRLVETAAEHTAVQAKLAAEQERQRAELERHDLWLYSLNATVDPETLPPPLHPDTPPEPAGKYRPCRVLYPDGRQRKATVVAVNLMPPDAAVTALHANKVAFVSEELAEKVVEMWRAVGA